MKLISLAILVLWPCYVGTLGASLFSDLYRVECAKNGVLWSVLALLSGCCSFVAFSLFRAFAGFCDCSEKYALVTLNAQLAFIGHTMVAFYCLLFTALGFSLLERLQCTDAEPPVAPLVIVCVINSLNGFMGIEQFGRTGFTVVGDLSELSGEERAAFIANARIEASGVRIVYEGAESLRSATPATAPVATTSTRVQPKNNNTFHAD